MKNSFKTIMYFNWLYRLFTCCILCVAFTAKAKEIIVSDSFAFQPVEESEFLIFEDPERQLIPTTWNAINYPFYKYKQNAGVGTSAWWLKLNVLNTKSTADTCHYLYTDHAAFESLCLYQKSENDELLIDSAGCKIPFSSRKVKINSIAFKLLLRPGLNTFYLRIATPIVKIPFSIVSDEELNSRVKQQKMFYSWLNGILFFLMLLSGGSAVYLKKDRIYMKYFIYVLCIIISFNSYIGYSFQLLWPEFPVWNSKAYLFFGVLLMTFHLLFALDLLQIKKRNKNYNAIVTYFAYLLAIVSVFILILDIFYGAILAQVFICVSIPFSLYMLYYAVKDKSKIGLYYIAGYILFILPMALESIKYLKFMPLYFQGNDDFLYLGMVIEILLFSVALGYRAKENLKILEMDEIILERNRTCMFVSLPELTKKENEIFNLIGQGFTDVEIADKTSITLHTIKFHLKNIFQKLGIKNRIMLVHKYEGMTSEKESNVYDCSL